MLKRYKNEFLQAIQSAGFDVSDFQGKEETVADHPEFRIHYTPGKIFFMARQHKDGASYFRFRFSRFTGIGSPPESGLFPPSDWWSFERVLIEFRQWLDREVRTAIEEQFMPDLWSQATSGFIGAHSIDSQGASKFTEEERQQIKLAVLNFRLLIKETFAPTEDQLTVVTEQLEYLASSVDRLNRFDWKAVAISTVMTISVALSLDTERGRQLFGLLQHAFSALTHLLR